MISWIRSGVWRNSAGWLMIVFPVAVLILVSSLSSSFLYWLPHLILALICAPVVFYTAIVCKMVRDDTKPKPAPDSYFL